MGPYSLSEAAGDETSNRAEKAPKGGLTNWPYAQPRVFFIYRVHQKTKKKTCTQACTDTCTTALPLCNLFQCKEEIHIFPIVKIGKIDVCSLILVWEGLSPNGHIFY